MELPIYCMFVIILQTVAIRSGTFDEAVLQATCYIERPEPSYVKNCINTKRAVKFLEEEADANVTFICRDTQYIVLGHNPGVFVIEHKTENESWSGAMMGYGTETTIRQLWGGAVYEFRFHRVFPNGISKSEITEPITTMTGLKEPKKVSNISTDKMTIEDENPHRMRLEISFIPSEDRPCFYEVTLWNERNYVKVNTLKDPVKFETVFSNLSFDMEYMVHVTALNRLDLRSGIVATTLRTPTCLNIYENLTMCAPDEVHGLHVQTINKVGTIFDVDISWDKPKLLPDNYIVELLPISSEITKPFVHNVSGTKTRTLFPDVKILDLFDVAIRAYSSGGRGPQIVVNLADPIKYMPLTEISLASKVGNILMIFVASLGLVVGSSAYAYHCYRKREQRQWRVDYLKKLRMLDRKDSAIDDSKDIGESGPMKVEVKDLLKSVDEYEIDPDRLEIKQLLGSGAFGNVKLGSLRDDRGQVTVVAVKMLRDDPSEEDQRGFELEIKIMKSAGQHPNIVSLLGCCTIGPRPLLIVEYCSQGDLQSFLRTILAKATVWVLETKKQCVLNKMSAGNNEKAFGNDDNARVPTSVANYAYDVDQDSFSDSGIVTVMDLLNFGRQVATGMEFLSSNRVVHRDLAARNVLVCHDRTVKISDFGLSRDIYQENVYKKQSNGRLPVKWMAIEALTHQVYSTYSDVWSFGILLWEIVTLGSSPYPEIPTNEVLKRLKSGYRMERPANCSLPLYNVMLSCWQAKPRDRPTFTILREEMDKLICMAAENDYLDLDDVSKGTPSEENDSHLTSRSYACLPVQLTYVNDLADNESRAARQEHAE